jgi:alkylation response protein AidB-like acyl-CoA dehydrogenase
VPLTFYPPLQTDEAQCRKKAQQLYHRWILPTALADDRSHLFRPDVFKTFAKEGLAALAVPKAFGGGGFSYRCHYGVIEELAKGPLAFSITLAVTNLVMGGLLAFGNETQKKLYLPKLTSGEWLGAFSLSEPQSGSDAAGLMLKAKKVEGGYSLTGTKCWCSNGSDADLFLVMGRTGEHKTKGISSFLVSKNTPGLRIGKQESKLGLKASSLTELIFEECFISDAQLLGKEGDGFAVALSQLDAGRIGIGACGTGLATAAIECMQKELNGSFGQSCLFKEAIAHKFGEYYARLQAVKSLITLASELKDQKQDIRVLASQIKLLGSDLAMEASQDLVHFLGERGYQEEEEVERFFRDAKALQIVEGTNQIQRLVIAKEMEKMV